MVPKLLARVDVGEVDLHHRNADRRDRVPQGDAREGVVPRVERNAVIGSARRVEPVEQLPLVVGLEKVARVPPLFGVGRDPPG